MIITNILLGCLVLIESLHLIIRIYEIGMYTYEDEPIDDEMIKRLYS